MTPDVARFVHQTKFVKCALCMFLLLYVPLGLTQDAVEPDVSAREILEANKAAAELVEEKEQSEAQGIEALSTPLNAMLGLRKAMSNQDHEKAAEFLDRRYLPQEMEQYSSEKTGPGTRWSHGLLPGVYSLSLSLASRLIKRPKNTPISNSNHMGRASRD